MPHDIFISYSSRDKLIAEKVCTAFEESGLACWIAPRNIPPGSEFDVAILDAIDQCQAVIVILSSDANTSSFVKNEVNRAFSRGKAILTFRIEDILPSKSLEFYLARHQWADGFPPPVEHRIAQMVKALLELLGKVAKQDVAGRESPSPIEVTVNKAPDCSPVTAPSVPVTAKGPLVAIVEDEQDTNQILAKFLKNKVRTEPVCFFAGRDVIPWAQADHPDIIVLDIILPDIDGFAICEALKSRRATNLIYILVVTALTGMEDKEHGLKCGANMYLTKPFTAKEFLQSIDEAMCWKDRITRFGRKGRIRFSLNRAMGFLKELSDFRSALFVHTHFSDQQIRHMTETILYVGRYALEREQNAPIGNEIANNRLTSPSMNPTEFLVDYFIDKLTLTIVIRGISLEPGFEHGLLLYLRTLDPSSIEEAMCDGTTKELRIVKHLS